MKGIQLPYRAKALLSAVAIGVLLPNVGAQAQTVADRLLPPPAEAPDSRLTVTPGEFEQWMAPSGAPAVSTDKPEATPSIATAPPAPTLVTPPAPPILAAPPSPAPSLAPTPAPRAAPPASSVAPTSPPPPPPPASSAAPSSPPSPPPATPSRPPEKPSVVQAPAPTLSAPPAPKPAAPPLEAPQEPHVATLPPQSPVTAPPAPVIEPLVRPDNVKVLYEKGAMDLPEAAKADLDRMAAWLKQNPAVRVQIIGFASAGKGAESEARRTSLYRTLAVRKYLVDKGILSTRMDVRAMGSKTEEMPKDRVEIALPPS